MNNPMSSRDSQVTDGLKPDEVLAHLAAIVQSSEDAIISKTLKGIIVSWNAGAERIYGYRAAEAIGRSMTMLLPDDRADEEPEILERIKCGEQVEHFETVRRTKNGELIEVSLTVSPIRDANGQITGASHVARNITATVEPLEYARQVCGGNARAAVGNANASDSLINAVNGAS